MLLGIEKRIREVTGQLNAMETFGVKSGLAHEKLLKELLDLKEKLRRFHENWPWKWNPNDEV
jgi:hypothetical protein